MSKDAHKQIQDLTDKLEKASAECSRLHSENERLKKLLGLPLKKNPEESHTPCKTNQASPNYNQETSIIVTQSSTSHEKMSLFRSLFQGREDVYPVRWESKDGRSGYTPACANEWKRPLCRKPHIKCAKCDHRQLLSITDQVVYNHLSGKHTIGVYPLFPGHTCKFLAADFDKSSWKEDASVFMETCSEMGIPAVLERSRSGNGAHVWIFFKSHVPAAMARNLGCVVLTRAMDKKGWLDLDSYDSFFPKQDTLPRGGFGNLIALPLQYIPRTKGNSVFLDSSLEPHKDQWAFLSRVEKMTLEQLDILVKKAKRSGCITGISRIAEQETDDDSWTRPSSKKTEKTLTGPFPSEVRVILSDLVYLAKKDLPAELLSRLVKMAAFHNPEFYKAQAMRLNTYGKPRIIGCAEDLPDYVGLPRGCLEEASELFQSLNIRMNISDQRFSGHRIDVRFSGNLTDLQHKAAKAILKHDCGVLSAATAFGKTVVGAWIIAERMINTLVLVHRRQLMDQWLERLSAFLDLPQNLNIGRFGGGSSSKVSGMIDIATLQSLNRKGVVNDIVEGYGQVIVDECHHISAFSFEQVLRQTRATYVCGLTSTPIRKNGHHPIIFMQCGPLRYRVDAKKQAAERPFKHIVFPRYTNFSMPDSADNPAIHEVYNGLAENKIRNELIFDDLLKSLDSGRSPLVLAQRVSQVEYFETRLKRFAKNVVVLRGGMGKKQRLSINERLAAISDLEERVIIATGNYIGEGFDDARLDALFLVSPISWKGTLQQYAGRLHRLHHNKFEVHIYDYVDHKLPQLAKMFEKRLKGYRAMGYEIYDQKAIG
ncbi:MAG: DEAD/DEAH box helicase [Desulfovibrionales bacterium]|nr:DEAD/DEAH box helicase [Desulfovibrionales bacterium]